MFITLGPISGIAGVPVDLFQNYPALRSQQILANNVYFQVSPGNSGNVYIGQKTLVKTTKVGLICILLAPSPPPAGSLPDLSLSLIGAMNPFPLNDYMVDWDNSGDSVLVTAIVW